MSLIFNERYEINHKLKYTCDDQRKVRLTELENADPISKPTNPPA